MTLVLPPTAWGMADIDGLLLIFTRRHLGPFRLGGFSHIVLGEGMGYKEGQ